MASLIGCGDNAARTPPPSLVISAESLTVAEGGSTTFTIALSDPMQLDAAVQVLVADGMVATVSPQVVTFAVGDVSPKTITVTGAPDNNLANQTTSITLSASDINAGSVALTVTDDDTQAIVITSSAITLTEGATGTLGVHLAFEPAAATSVTIASGDAARLGVSPASLSFTTDNYATAQTVTLTAMQDDDIVANTAMVTFVSAGLTSATATATIADNDVQGISVTPGALALLEADVAVPGRFEVTLNQQPSADVLINLASSDPSAASVSPATLTFTAANYADGTAHVVTVTPVSDNNTSDEILAIMLAGGSLNASVPVTVADDDVQAIMTNPNTVAVTENDSTTVGVSLGFDPGAEVTVTVASADPAIAGAAPSTLTFNSTNYSIGQNVSVTGTPDLDLANESTSLTMTSSGIATRTVTVNVTDDDSQSIVLTYAGEPGPLTLAEGTAGSPSTTQVGVRLAFQPATAVTLAVASDNPNLTTGSAMLTFQPADFATVQFVTLTAVDETNLDDETAIVAFSGGGTTRNLDVTIPDTDVQGFFVSPTTLPVVDEGTSTTFQVRMNFAPSAPVTATVTSSNSKFQVNGATSTTITIPAGNALQTVTLAVTQDLDAQDETATLTISDTGAGSTIQNRTIAAAANDDETMSFVLTPVTTDTISGRLDLIEEGPSVTFEVALSAAPIANTTVTLTPSMTNTVEVSTDGTTFGATTTLAFTPSNYGNRMITVRGLADLNLVDELFAVTVAGPATLGAPAASVFMRKIENDAQAIVTIPTAPGPLAVTEGTTTPLAVRLQFQPVQSVQVTLTPSNAEILLGSAAVPTTLLFTTTNYDQPQIVQVGTPDDDDQFDDASGTVTVSSPALTSHVITVDLFDDDDQEITLSAPSLTINEPNTVSLPDSGTFTVRLDHVPTASTETVTLTVPADAISKVDLCDALNTCGDSMQLAFTNATGTAGGWDSPQTVTVRASADADVENHTIAIALTSDREPFATAMFTVTVVDDDQLNLVVSPGTTATVHEPGGVLGSGPTTADFSATLNFNPTTDLVIDLTSLADSKATVSPATLTFTAANYAIAQPFTVTAIEDADVRDEAVSIELTSSRTSTVALAIAVEDYDQQALVHDSGLAIDEGASATMAVRLAQQPTADVIVAVGSVITPTLGLEPQTVLVNGQPATSLTFTSTNWDASQMLTVSSPEDADLDHFGGDVTLAISSAQTNQELAQSSAGSFAVRDNDSQEIIVTADPTGLTNSAQSGGPYVQFLVRLASRPRLGQQDTVRLLAPASARFMATGGTQLDVVFGPLDFGTDQVVRWYVQDGGLTVNNNVTGAITLAMQSEELDQPAPFGAANANDTDAHAVRGLDADGLLLIGRLDLATGYNGATQYTQRSNIAFGLNGTAEGIVAFTARSTTTGGDALLGFTDRALGTTTAGPQFASGGLDPTTEIVLFDADEDGPGPDVAAWNVFSSSTLGIVYARYGVAGNPLVAPAVIAPATDNATDFSVARNGAVYGVIYRREATSRNNLYFRTVTIETGAASGEQLSTTANTFVHFHPTLIHADTTFDLGTGPIAAPYAVLYSENGTTKLVRLTGSGAPIVSHTFGPEFPGDFGHAIYLENFWFPGIFATAIHSTGPGFGDNAVFLHGIQLPSSGVAAEYRAQRQLTSMPLAPISPPVIAFNGGDGLRGNLAIAYDSGLGGVNQVGVALFNPNAVGERDYRLDAAGDEGLFPAITWALDRWVLRYQADTASSNGIRIRTGSFGPAGTGPIL